MPRTLNVLIASRSEPALRALREALAGRPGFECAAKHISNGHADPLHGVAQRPDVLVLRIEPGHLGELAALAEQDAASRPALIIVGAAAGGEAMRLAIRSGAKDLLPEPVAPEELVAAIERMRAELPAGAAADGEITAVIGAAGGVGTSFLACNLAHLVVAEGQRSAVLVDLDLQYAPLAHYLDLHPERGLLEALEVVDTLDEHALQGYLARHRSGLQVLGAAKRGLVTDADVHGEWLAVLLRLLAVHAEHVVVDCPHRLDRLNTTALGMARHVLLVVQQSVAQVRNAAHLMQMLTRDLAIPRDRLRVVVNRYDKRAAVTLDDIEQALDREVAHVVPSQYEPALGSIDTGVPLHELDGGTGVGKALMEALVALGAVQRQASRFDPLAFFRRK